MRKITKLPWNDIFTDLEKKGYTDLKMIKALGVPRESYKRWREGTEPKESIARAILSVHATQCGHEKTLQRITEAR